MKEVTLHNPVAPVLFLVTDPRSLSPSTTGTTWASVTSSPRIRPKGATFAVYRLMDVFSKEEIDTFKHSVSSIWWRTDTVYVRESQQSVYVALDDRGSELILERETGAWQYRANRGSVRQCRGSRDSQWRPYQEPRLRP